MFRDTQEELERLEHELLAEEPQPETEEEEDYDEFLEEPDSDEPIVYRNFSNHYGADLRNYATGYKAYNSDNVDTDLEQFSHEVRDGKKKNGIWLPLLTALLSGLAVLYIIWELLRGVL